jgi:hypothetical protein
MLRKPIILLSFVQLVLLSNLLLPAFAQVEPGGAGALTFAELREQVDAIDASTGTKEQGAELVAAWVDANEITPLTQEDLWWILVHFHQADMSLDDKKFSAKWTGFIEVPVSGEYTFFQSPLDINFESGPEFARQTTSIRVGTQTVLDSTLDSWTSEADPISLNAGERVPIEVDLTYHRSTESLNSKPAVAQLYWEGPAMEKSLVPANVLFSPTGDENGLLAEYRSNVNGSEQTRSRIESVIDRCWLHKGSVMPKYPVRQADIVERLHGIVTAPDYFEAWAAQGFSEANDLGPSDKAYIYRKTLGFLSSEQRAAAARSFLLHPAVLQVLSSRQAEDYYNLFRIGSLDAALEVFGEWAQLHPNIEPALGADYHETNRLPYRNMNIGILWQYRPHFQRLHKEYLEMADGSCCLPVAYVTAYGHLVTGQIVTWIDYLDEKLEDETVVGDHRINWLLARGMTEEVRRCPPHRARRGIEQLRAGDPWIVEGLLIAESPSINLRLAKERIARLAALQDWSAAEEGLVLLDGTTDKAEWTTAIEELQLQAANRAQAYQTGLKASVLSELKRRQARATLRDDSAGETRYASLIEELENNGETEE